MTPARWRAVVELVDARGRHPVTVGTYCTEREAAAAAASAVVLHAVPRAVEVIR